MYMVPLILSSSWTKYIHTFKRLSHLSIGKCSFLFGLIFVQRTLKIVTFYFLHKFDQTPRWNLLTQGTWPLQVRKFNPIPTRLSHVIYYHGDKKYPCLVGIGIRPRCPLLYRPGRTSGSYGLYLLNFFYMQLQYITRKFYNQSACHNNNHTENYAF